MLSVNAKRLMKPLEWLLRPKRRPSRRDLRLIRLRKSDKKPRLKPRKSVVKLMRLRLLPKRRQRKQNGRKNQPRSLKHLRIRQTRTRRC
jgi:hypothetical protein